MKQRIKRGGKRKSSYTKKIVWLACELWVNQSISGSFILSICISLHHHMGITFIDPVSWAELFLLTEASLRFRRSPSFGFWPLLFCLYSLSWNIQVKYIPPSCVFFFLYQFTILTSNWWNDVSKIFKIAFGLYVISPSILGFEATSGKPGQILENCLSTQKQNKIYRRVYCALVLVLIV